ncbi:hypothetical protein F511_31253 [Dorcoceras hygrometricum]|uniref:Uncharacterized protein n=1 Tax=Dorcoceras hygrometricum TaxID=472368 RepID=A0A2Z7AJG1_9LAMI|nr:hypothetical protein F511_31253 [Dorcoceras hygrometricum]
MCSSKLFAEKFVYCSRGRILQGSAAVAKLRLRQATADGIVVVLMVQMSSYVPAAASP